MSVTSAGPSGRPLYEQVKSAITRRIDLDEWTTDFKIPSEDALAAEFSVSSPTVRRALRELQEEGILVRIQGRGTFVAGPRMQCAIFDLRDVAEEIAASGGVHSCEIVALTALGGDDPLARQVFPAVGGPLFHSRIVHREDGTPIQLEDRFVNAREAPHYLDQDFSAITTHAYLLQATEITSVENSIRAVRPGDEARLLLRIDDAQPCLLLDRRTWRGDVPVTRSRFLYPGDRYRLRSAHDAVIRRAPLAALPSRSRKTRRLA
ncbi:MAG: UTRA domain-containing protein [Rhodobacteraceae bacterium]|nr:UTRA domain-containing protein [Paracoccaceae bacterium]